MMCSRIAIAAVAVGFSVATAGIVVSPFGPARATETAAPVIERIVIGAGQVGLVEGKSAPGAHVVLRANGRLFGHGVAGDNGLWRVETSRPLEAGDYRISVTSRTVGVDRDVSGEDVRVALPADGGPARAALPRIAGGNADEQLLRAGTLAEAATKRFDEIMTGGAAKQGVARVAQADTRIAPTASGSAAGTEMRMAEVRAPETRLAQAGTAERSTAGAPGGRGEDDFLNPVWAWLERANSQYQGVIVKQLSAGEPATSLAAPSPAATPLRTAIAQPTATSPAVSTPKAPSPLSQRVGQLPSASATNAAAPATAEKDFFEHAQGAVTSWLDSANRQYQAVIVRRLSDPNPSESAMPSPRSVPAGIATVAELAPTAPVAQARAVEEAARLAEQQRREAEAKRLAEMKAKADEDARLAAAKAKADADAARAKADEDARRVAAAAAAKAKADAEARARAEADAKVRAEADAKLRAEQEARRLAAAAAAAAAKSKADAEAKARAEDDARRVAAAARAKADADEKARVDAEAKSRAELETRRVAAAAAAMAKVEAEAKQKAEADAKAASAAVAVVAAAAARAEQERQVAAAKAKVEAKRVADAAKAVSDRQAAEAARITRAKLEQERRAAEVAAAAKAAVEKAAVAKAATEKVAAEKAALSKVAAPVAVASRASVQRTVRPAKRLAGTGSSRQMGSAGGKLKLAKVAIKRVCPGVCRQVAGKRVKQGGWYVVKRGDSLWHIARMHYGDGNRYRFLRKVNRSQLGMSNVIYPCQRIAIPRVGR